MDLLYVAFRKHVCIINLETACGILLFFVIEYVNCQNIFWMPNLIFSRVFVRSSTAVVSWQTLDEEGKSLTSQQIPDKDWSDSALRTAQRQQPATMPD